MNMQTTDNVKPKFPVPSEGYGGRHRSGEDEARGYRDLLENLWDGRYLILGSVLTFLVVGGVYAWRATTIYEAQAMLQIRDKKNASAAGAFPKMEGVFSGPGEASVELEILKSKDVLGRVVKTLNIGVYARPVLLPVIGGTLARLSANPPLVEVESFVIPEDLAEQPFRLTVLPGDRFRWEGPDKVVLGEGKVGETLKADLGKHALSLQVRRLIGKPGQEFLVSHQSFLHAVDALRGDFDVSQRGKDTNVIGLTLTNPSPKKAAEILNEIINQYIQHNYEEKGGQMNKTLSMLREQLPLLQPKLSTAESRLNSFKSTAGAVDLSREADNLLQQSSSRNTQISALRQRKEELLRTYTESADVVVTLDQQIKKLEEETNKIDMKIRSLPNKEQEVVRLSRDVQVNTELYTALLNNIQQLQIAGSGSLSNIVVVDHAIPNPDPVRPNKKLMMIIFFAMGALVGIGLSGLRRLLRPGIEDHRLIESRLGLPVVVTIPHSDNQEVNYLAMRKNTEGTHLLAILNPEDLATESLRSVRTTLHVSMHQMSSRVLMLTGPSMDVGKSFVSSNLSVTLAQAGAKVLLVDGDLRKGTLHKYFGFKNRLNGLAEILSGRLAWEAVVRSNHQDQESRGTAINGLDLITTGILPKNPSELLMSSGFSTFLAETAAAYDYVIIDSPPLLSVTDAEIIASKVDSVMLVARYGRHPLDEIRTCQRRLMSHGIPLAGCIFNDVRVHGLGYNQYRYAYHYTYNATK